MKDIQVIGLDLAKQIFHLVGLTKSGHLIFKKKLRRNQLKNFFSNLKKCTIAMEGCAGSHYWARCFQNLGHDVKILPAQYVKAYVRGNKNDYNDSLAIAEASQVKEMKLVPIKAIKQQELQALHRLRQKYVKQRTASCNQARGILAEFGIVIPQGINNFRKHFLNILSDETNGLSLMLRDSLGLVEIELNRLDEFINQITCSIEMEVKNHREIRLLQTIPGFGPINSSLFYSTFGNGSAYDKGRDVSAALGLVPRQHSTGGKQLLLGISKRGDKHLRSQLVHGARAVIRVAKNKSDLLSQWINRLIDKRGINKATVALANKMARIAWAVLRSGKPYQIDFNYHNRKLVKA